MSKFTMLLTFLLIHDPSLRGFFDLNSLFPLEIPVFGSFTNLGQVAAFTSLRSYLNDLIPFERPIQQTIETIPLSPKTITAVTLWQQTELQAYESYNTSKKIWDSFSLQTFNNPPCGEYGYFLEVQINHKLDYCKIYHSSLHVLWWQLPIHKETNQFFIHCCIRMDAKEQGNLYRETSESQTVPS